MSGKREQKIIHVDSLIIHAKEVKVVHEKNHGNIPRRDPWGFLFGGVPHDNKHDPIHHNKYDQTNDFKHEDRKLSGYHTKDMLIDDEIESREYL